MVLQVGKRLWHLPVSFGQMSFPFTTIQLAQIFGSVTRTDEKS